MVRTTGPYPVFWYIYSPRAKRIRRDRGAEGDKPGLNVALYSNSVMSYSKYDRNHQVVEQGAFQLPQAVMDRYMMILQSATWWLQMMPLTIPNQHSIPDYSCMYGFLGHPILTCDEIHKKAQLSEGNLDGIHARRLQVMMEFITEMLYEHGVLLQMDDLRWDWNRIQPLTPEQLSAMQMPAAQELEEETHTSMAQ